MSDVAINASLAALATLPRAELKHDILGNSELKYNMDHGGAAYTRDLVEAFVGAKYKKVLDILAEHKVKYTSSSNSFLEDSYSNRLQWRLVFDLHLQPQVTHLINAIRHRAYVQYFEPFQNVQLSRMATSFGVDEERARPQFEKDVIGLIQDGMLKARVDDIEKVCFVMLSVDMLTWLMSSGKLGLVCCETGQEESVVPGNDGKRRGYTRIHSSSFPAHAAVSRRMPPFFVSLEVSTDC